MRLEPINRMTTAQSIAQRLLEFIRSGVLKPGDRLPAERDLMDQLQVGRSSIREALQILATLNVVEMLPGNGTYIREPQPSEILRAEVIGILISNTVARELLEAREMIEPASTRLAALRGTEENFANIQALLDEHAQALAVGASINEHAARFHVMLAVAAQNRVIVKFMESILELLMQRGRKVDRIPGYSQQELEEHRMIFELVKARRADEAAEAMHQHIIRAAVTYDSTLPDAAGTLLAVT